MTNMRTCDAPGCDEQIRAGKLMCRDHWYALPNKLRQAINESWRGRRREGGMRIYSANVLEARACLASAEMPA